MDVKSQTDDAVPLPSSLPAREVYERDRINARNLHRFFAFWTIV
jgi:hypothetical protein